MDKSKNDVVFIEEEEKIDTNSEKVEKKGQGGGGLIILLIIGIVAVVIWQSGILEGPSGGGGVEPLPPSERTTYTEQNGEFKIYYVVKNEYEDKTISIETLLSDDKNSSCFGIVGNSNFGELKPLEDISISTTVKVSKDCEVGDYILRLDVLDLFDSEKSRVGWQTFKIKVITV